MQTIQSKNNDLLETLSSIILFYSRMPIKSHLFSQDLFIQIILGASFTNIIQLFNLKLNQIDYLLLGKSRKSKRVQAHNIIFIHHAFCIEETREFILCVFKKVTNCIVLFDDGSIVHNYLEHLHETNFTQKKISAIIIKTQVKPICPKQYKIEEINLQKNQQMSSFLEKKKEFQQKETQQTIHVCLNTQENKSIIYLEPQTLVGLFAQIQQYLAVVEIYHSHVNLSVCVYTFSAYFQHNLKLQEGNQDNETFQQETEENIHRKDIPDTAEYFTLKQRASKITEAELHQLQLSQLNKYYEIQTNYSSMIESMINCRGQQLKFLTQIKEKTNKIGNIYKINFGADSFVIWVTYKGIPVLKILPSFISSSKYKSDPDKKMSKSVQKLMKMLQQEKNNLGFIKYKVKQKYQLRQKEQVIEDTMSQYGSSSQSCRSIDEKSIQKQKNTQKCSIYIIDLFKQYPPQSSPYFYSFCQIFTIVCLQIAEFFLKSIKLKWNFQKELKKLQTIDRIVEILNETDLKEQKNGKLYHHQLMKKFYFDCI